MPNPHGAALRVGSFVLGMTAATLVSAEGRAQPETAPAPTRWVASVAVLRILNQDVACTDSDACGGAVTQDGPGWGLELGFGPRLRLGSTFDLYAQASLRATRVEADHLDPQSVQTRGDSPVNVTTLGGGANLSVRARPTSFWYAGLGLRGGVYHASGSVDVTTVTPPTRDLTASYADTAGYYGALLETGFFLDGRQTFELGPRATFDISGGLGSLAAGIYVGWALLP